MRTHDYVVHLAWIAELTLNTHGECLCTNVHRTIGDVMVLCADGRADLQRRETISLHLARVEIHVDLTLWSTRDTYRTHTVDTCQWVCHTIVKNLVESLLRFLCLNGEHDDRNHIGRELEQDRCLCFVRKRVRHHVKLVSHVVGKRINIITELKLEGDDGYVLTRVTCDMLQVLHRVQGVLKWTCYVILNIISRRTVIVRHDHDRVGINIRIKVDRELYQGEDTENDDCRKAEACHNRSFDRAFV